jgi:hypothetical protein
MEISTSTLQPYFTGTVHPVPQPGVAIASALIVFTVILSGVTGIVPIVTDKQTGNREKRSGMI